MSSGPKVVCRIELEFASPEEADRISRAVAQDNDGYLETKVDGPILRAEIKTESLKSLLHTLDDFLACTSVAEKVVSKTISRQSP